METLTYIFIPTLGRLSNQIAYNQLPKWLKDITYFVVQSQEYNEMVNLWGEHKVLKLPPSIKNIAYTRQWIHTNFGNCIYWVIDDDIKFKRRDKVDGGWKYRFFNDDDFIECVQTFEDWLNGPYTFCAMVGAEVIPTPTIYPYNENAKVMTNVCYNGKKLPKDLDWTSVPYGEDIHLTMQLLTSGHKNIISTKFVSSNNVTNAKGGCSTTRTLKKHNDSQKLLASKWPNFISIKNKKLSTGNRRKWVCDDDVDADGDPYIVNLICYFKKAYASSKIK